MKRKIIENNMKEGNNIDCAKLLEDLKTNLEMPDIEIEKAKKEIAKLKEQKLELLQRDDLFIMETDGDLTKEAKKEEYEGLLAEINEKIILAERKIKNRVLDSIKDLKQIHSKKED